MYIIWKSYGFFQLIRIFFTAMTKNPIKLQLLALLSNSKISKKLLMKGSFSGNFTNHTGWLPSLDMQLTPKSPY